MLNNYYYIINISFYIISVLYHSLNTKYFFTYIISQAVPGMRFTRNCFHGDAIWVGMQLDVTSGNIDLPAISVMWDQLYRTSCSPKVMFWVKANSPMHLTLCERVEDKLLPN